MKYRLAKKIWKEADNSLFPCPKKYWQVKWSNSQFYEGAIYDHRIIKAYNIITKRLSKQNHDCKS